MIFQGLKAKAQSSSNFMGLGLPSPALETPRDETVKLLISWAKSLISVLSKNGARIRLPLSFLRMG